MIKYKLICKECKNLFDSWFSSSKEYDRLKKKKFLNCLICDSLNVEKTLMSPNVLIPKNELNSNKEIKKFKETKELISKYQEH